MAFTLRDVVPWGRSYEEYVAFFGLGEAEPGERILGCGDGPASFNTERTARGGRVVSLDPIYRFPAAAIAARIDEAFEEVLAETERNRGEFVWRHVADAAELARLRRAAMERFLADYRRGAGRYVAGALPALPFRDGAFDLALCSHFLFLYSERFSADFHVRAIAELARVAREARIFPLLELGARPSRHLESVLARLRGAGLECAVERVGYEFQRGGNRMLRVRRAAPG